MTTVAPATGYTVVLPPGWVRVPLRRGTEAALEEKVFKGMEVVPEGVPRDRAVVFRMEVRRRVARLVADARKAGGLDLYVPVGARRGALLAASFLVSEIIPGEGEGVPRELAVGRLVKTKRGGEGGELRGIGESAVAVRWEYVESAKGDGVVDSSARHVDYVLPVPGEEGRWLAVNFSTAGNGDPGSEYARAHAELFDALMTTFRWEFAR